jgi:hypothetical protein
VAGFGPAGKVAGQTGVRLPASRLRMSSTTAISTRVKPGLARFMARDQGMHRATSGVADGFVTGQAGAGGEGEWICRQGSELAGGSGRRGWRFQVASMPCCSGPSRCWLPRRSPAKIRAPRQAPGAGEAVGAVDAAGVAHHPGPVGGRVAQIGVAAGALSACRGGQPAEFAPGRAFGRRPGGQPCLWRAVGAGLEDSLQPGAVAGAALELAVDVAGADGHQAVVAVALVEGGTSMTPVPVVAPMASTIGLDEAGFRVATAAPGAGAALLAG